MSSFKSLNPIQLSENLLCTNKVNVNRYINRTDIFNKFNLKDGMKYKTLVNVTAYIKFNAG